MLRLQLIRCIVAICFVTHGGLSYGQERNIRPYLGAYGSLGPSGYGWGAEAGMHLLSFYAGLEYGIAYPWPVVMNYDPVPGSVAPPGPVSSEQFWGLHAGYVLDTSYYIGIVILKSSQTWDSWDTSMGYNHAIRVPSIRTFLNVGPDFRYTGFARGHIYLDLAYTTRRGFKTASAICFEDKWL